MSATPLHLEDDEITTDWRAAGPTEKEDDRDAGGSGDADTGDDADQDTTDFADPAGGGDLDTNDEA